MLLLSGYLQFIPDMNSGWQWITTVLFTRWGFEALMLSAFDSDKNSDYLNTYSFKGENVRLCYTWLGIYLAGLQLLVLLNLMPPLWNMQQVTDDLNEVSLVV